QNHWIPIKNCDPSLQCDQAAALQAYWNQFAPSASAGLIDAVYIDEPYVTELLNAGKKVPASLATFCANQPDEWESNVAADYALFRSLAAMIKRSSPRTRFWINFSETELWWMMNLQLCNPVPNIAFNGPFIDVISMDKYGKPLYGPLSDPSCQPAYGRYLGCL